MAIACALANDPPLILCDEPTGALDTENGDLVMNTLFQAQKDLNTAGVIVTHDPRIAERADRRPLHRRELKRLMALYWDAQRTTVRNGESPSRLNIN